MLAGFEPRRRTGSAEADDHDIGLVAPVERIGIIDDARHLDTGGEV